MAERRSRHCSSDLESPRKATLIHSVIRDSFAAKAFGTTFLASCASLLQSELAQLPLNKLLFAKQRKLPFSILGCSAAICLLKCLDIIMPIFSCEKESLAILVSLPLAIELRVLLLMRLYSLFVPSNLNIFQ
eukprot:m.136942 g.136942  ORF g.136942 m.136942 type:complete len:132 (+) comp52483_c0_seq1:707-1102(+)